MVMHRCSRENEKISPQDVKDLLRIFVNNTGSGLREVRKKGNGNKREERIEIGEGNITSRRNRNRNGEPLAYFTFSTKIIPVILFRKELTIVMLPDMIMP